MSNQNNKPLRLVVEETEKLEIVSGTAIETTLRLGKRINKLFLSAFSDYVGCHISVNTGNGAVNMNQMFMVELHFKPLPAGAIDPNDKRVRAFKPMNEAFVNNAGMVDIYSGLQQIYWNQTASNSKKYAMSENAAQILSEFMIARVDPWKPESYDMYLKQYSSGPAYSNGPEMMKLVCVDLTKLIRKIYGRFDEDKNELEYTVIPFRPVNNFAGGNPIMQGNANWYVNITPINVNKLKELAVEMGMAATNMDSQIITGY